MPRGTMYSHIEFACRIENPSHNDAGPNPRTKDRILRTFAWIGTTHPVSNNLQTFECWEHENNKSDELGTKVWGKKMQDGQAGSCNRGRGCLRRVMAAESAIESFRRTPIMLVVLAEA